MDSTIDGEERIYTLKRPFSISFVTAGPRGSRSWRTRLITYATEHIASTLKNARRAKGLGQRALGKKAAVPQSHISKIENGAVDLRVSSLVELARALHLELMGISNNTHLGLNH